MCVPSSSVHEPSVGTCQAESKFGSHLPLSDCVFIVGRREVICFFVHKPCILSMILLPIPGLHSTAK